MTSFSFASTVGGLGEGLSAFGSDTEPHDTGAWEAVLLALHLLGVG